MVYWKKVKEKWEVSNTGIVWSCSTNKEMRPWNNGKYKKISLGGKNYFVHKLMAEAFLEIPEHLKHLPTEKLQVNHKDENKLNNFIDVNEDGSVDYDKSNLEWCDNKYNNNYGLKNQRMTNTKIKKGIVDEKYYK